MKKTLLILISFAAASPSWALKSEGKVHPEWEAGTPSRIIVTVDPGFHLNEKAPNQLVVQPGDKSAEANLRKLEAKRAEFSVPTLKKNETVQVSVYVCDDALTVCEPREWSWNARGQLTAGGAAVSSVSTPNARQKPIVKESFYQDNLPFALDQCSKKKENGRVLLLFSARWCPGCVRLHQEVWTNAGMTSALEPFVKVKLDADRFANRGVMESYDVHGIPAILILDCQGKEIDRLSDYADRETIKNFLAAAAKPGVSPIAEVKSKAEKGDVAAARQLGERATWAYQPREALKWFAKVPDREKQRDYWISAVNAAQEDAAKNPALVKTTLEKAVIAFPQTVSSLDWRESLAELAGNDSVEGKKWLEEQVKVCDEAMGDPARLHAFATSEPAGDVAGYETFRVFMAKGDALEKLHRAPEAEATWKAGVAEGKKLGIKDEPSGPFLRFLPILKKAHETVRLKKFFEKYADGAHADPDLVRRYARFLIEQGDTKRAVKVAKRALDDSFDQNEIYVASVYAEALAKVGQAEQGRELLRRYQARTDLTARAKTDLESAMNKIR